MKLFVKFHLYVHFVVQHLISQLHILNIYIKFSQYIILLLLQNCKISSSLTSFFSWGQNHFPPSYMA